MTQLINIELPDIGDFKDVEVIEILVSPGDTISKEDSLLTLESDKATMEIPSPETGVISEIKISEGDKINKGDPIFLLKIEDNLKNENKSTPAKKEEAGDLNHNKEISKPEKTKSNSKTNEVIHIPDIGDFKDVEIIEILVSEGDVINKEDSLLTLETDKATMDIPSPLAGKIIEVNLKVGDRINCGDRFGAIIGEKSNKVEAQSEENSEALDESKPAPRQFSERIKPHQEIESTSNSENPEISGVKAHASPAIRKFARELGVNISLVKGSGNKKRITKEDVQSFVKSSLSDNTDAGSHIIDRRVNLVPDIDFSKFGDVEKVSLSRIQKISGKHLYNAWSSIPHVTQFDESDITELEKFRKDQKSAADKAGVKVTFMPFLMRALAVAMAEYPQFNASLLSDGETLVLKKYVNIGIAVDTPKGLVVPVVKDVNKKGIFDLAADLSNLSNKAREGKLTSDDLSGGCISISSLGGIGGTQFTPIVNTPEVAILGVSKAEMKPKWNGTEFKPRLIMPYSLSYDHRVIDGAIGVKFTSYLSQLLSDIRKLIL